MNFARKIKYTIENRCETCINYIPTKRKCVALNKEVSVYSPAMCGRYMPLGNKTFEILKKQAAVPPEKILNSKELREIDV